MKRKVIIIVSLIVCLGGLTGGILWFLNRNKPEEKDVQEERVEVDKVEEAPETELSTANPNFELSKEFEGEWKRTNIHGSFRADLTISDVQADKFHFKGTFYHYYNMSDLEGDAVCVSDYQAVYEDFKGENKSKRTLCFTLSDDGMYISSENPGWRELNGGYPEGEYTKGDPIYTNVNIMDETFSKEEVDVIKGLIPEENYDELFVTPTKIGYVTTKEITMRDGRKGRYIDCNLPGGNSYDAITCEDGMIYFRSYGYPRIGLETNDKEFTGDILPEYVDGDVPLNVQANYEPAEIFESEFGMPEIKLSETGFEITDNNHEMLKQRIDSLPDSEKYMIYRADNKVFSLRENRGNPIYYNYNMNGDTIYLRDVIYDFPSSCEDEILEQLEIYKKQYGIAWTSDFDISELSYDDVNFNLDSNSVVIYIDYYPYRITYKGHEDILNPDIIPSSDSAMIALLKIGKLTCADGTELNFNFVDRENSMEGLSLTVNGNEPSEIHSKLDMRKIGYGSAYYYYDGEGNQYLSIFNEGWLDEYFGNFLYKISDGNFQFLYSDNEHTQTFTQVSDILKYAGD